MEIQHTVFSITFSIHNMLLASCSTTHNSLILQDILKDAKHKLRPWELEKKRKIRGLKRALVPNLGYSQIYCYYR